MPLPQGVVAGGCGRLFVLLLLSVATTPGCGGGRSEADAGRVKDCSGVLDGGLLHLIVVEDNRCVTCDDSPGLAEYDYQCADLADSLEAGCLPYCDYGYCKQQCEGGCGDLAEPCQVGLGECEPPYTTVTGMWQCDPTCGASGGCRSCVFDDECVRDFGEGAVCQRHCGTCCGGTSGFDCTACQ